MWLVNTGTPTGAGTDKGADRLVTNTAILAGYRRRGVYGTILEVSPHLIDAKPVVLFSVHTAARRGYARRPRQEVVSSFAVVASFLSAVAKWGVLVWFASVLLFRFIAPPLTPLIAIRGVEYIADGKQGIRGWEWRPLEYFPAHVRKAIIAAEDARFMRHWGIDLSAVGNAIEDSDGARRPRGASTITMQTVKNVFLWPGRSYLRKGLEAIMAPIAGTIWGKRRTLELYLNVIEWGEGIYGLESASQFYFNRPASRLTASQAAALASILPNPRKLSPHELSMASRRRFDRIVRESWGVDSP